MKYNLMQETYHRLDAINAKLKNNLLLDYAGLETIFIEFKEISAAFPNEEIVSEGVDLMDMKEIEKNIRRMHKPGSILKKDVAFLLARNGLVERVGRMMEPSYYVIARNEAIPQ